MDTSILWLVVFVSAFSGALMMASIAADMMADVVPELPPPQDPRPERRFVNGLGRLWVHNHRPLDCCVCGKEIKHTEVPWFRDMNFGFPLYSHSYCYSSRLKDSVRGRRMGVCIK